MPSGSTCVSATRCRRQFRRHDFKLKPDLTTDGHGSTRMLQGGMHGSAIPPVGEVPHLVLSLMDAATSRTNDTDFREGPAAVSLSMKRSAGLWHGALLRSDWKRAVPEAGVPPGLPVQGFRARTLFGKFTRSGRECFVSRAATSAPRSPSPRPSPAGRGSLVVRARAIHPPLWLRHQPRWVHRCLSAVSIFQPWNFSSFFLRKRSVTSNQSQSCK